MASLHYKNAVKNVYLMAHHRIGRMTHSVDTYLNEPSVSRMHAIVEWDVDSWKVFDLSRNGTWLNGQKLIKDTRYSLSVGDRLNFGAMDQCEFVVESVSPPADYLEPVDVSDKGDNQVLVLKPYNLLPNDENPEIALYLDYSQTKWCLEPVNSNEFKARLVNEGELISIDGRRWKLAYNRVEEATSTLSESTCQLQDIHFQFIVSLDEESVQLVLRSPSSETDLGLRTHHYLTLTLARQKAQDIEAKVDETEQGWIYTDVLARDLGLAETHLNIQIHRARKQLMESLSEEIEADSFIQRRGGKVRLGINKLSVIKGSQVEKTIGNEVVKASIE